MRAKLCMETDGESLKTTIEGTPADIMCMIADAMLTISLNTDGRISTDYQLEALREDYIPKALINTMLNAEGLQKIEHKFEEGKNEDNG